MGIKYGWDFPAEFGFKGGGKENRGEIRVSEHTRKAPEFKKGGKVSRRYDRMEPRHTDTDDGMAKGGKWIGKAIKHPGALHRELGVPKGEKIPAKKLAKAAKAGGKLGQRARLAQTLKGMHKAKGGEVGDEKQDKRDIAKAVHKHERHDHPGKPLTKLKKGGKAKSAASKAAGALTKIAAAVAPQANAMAPAAAQMPLIRKKGGRC